MHSPRSCLLSVNNFAKYIDFSHYVNITGSFVQIHDTYSQISALPVPRFEGGEYLCNLTWMCGATGSQCSMDEEGHKMCMFCLIEDQTLGQVFNQSHLSVIVQ